MGVAEGGPPTDVEVAEAASFMAAAETADATTSPLIDTTRAMAYWIRTISRDRHPIDLP